MLSNAMFISHQKRKLNVPKFKANGIELYYKTSNVKNESDPWIVFLNGVMSTTASWQPYVEGFESRGFNVLTYNYRNQALSGEPKAMDLEEHVEDLRLLINHLKVTKCHLVGVSFGGIIAMKFALKYQESLNSLSVISTTPHLTNALKKTIDTWIELINLDDISLFFEGMHPFIYHPDYLAKNPDLLEKTVKAMPNVNSNFFRGQRYLYESLLRLDSLDINLENTKIPTQIISGSDDIVTPLSMMEIIHDSIQGSEWFILPNTAHGVLIEREKQLKTLLIGFIAKQERERYERNRCY